MIHDHACVGPDVTYCVAVAIGLGLATFAFGLFVAEHAARALCGWIARTWKRAGDVEDSRRIDQ